MMSQRIITNQTVELSPDVDLPEDRDRIIEGIRLAMNNSAETGGFEQATLRIDVEVSDEGIQFSGGAALSDRRATITVESRLT